MTALRCYSSSRFILAINAGIKLNRVNYSTWNIRRNVRSPKNQLGYLEATANSNLGDSGAQAAYYRALLDAKHPSLIVKRFEQSKAAHDIECLQIYADALEATGRSEDAQAARQESSQSWKYGSSFGPGKGSSHQPLYVQVVKPDKSKLMTFLKFVFTLGIVYGTFSLLTGSASEIISIIPKSKMREILPDGAVKPSTKFSDVFGVDEAKEDLMEIVDFLKNPEQFTRLGGRMPRGVLLTGPPGTGKTLLARAVAGEAGVPFFFMSASEFDEMYVGLGAKRVRDLFSKAREKSPSIIFIDELDTIGAKRLSRDHPFASHTLNQFLIELDGFEQAPDVIVIAATNYPESLDKALTRPGRFDKIVSVPLPDVRGRMSILKHYISKISAGTDVDTTLLARSTTGFSGADLSNLVNQAAIRASKVRDSKVRAKHFEWAKDTIILGSEKKSRVITDENKLITAYHEAGHAIVALYTNGAMPIYKATIVPRGMALGMVSQVPELDKLNYTKKEFMAMIDVCMGGRAAEELYYGKENATSGAANDFKSATNIARQMIGECGFSDKLGPINLVEDAKELSSHTRQLFEEEIRDCLDGGLSRATSLLQEKQVEHKRLVQALLEHETLTREEIMLVVEGKSLHKPILSTRPSRKILAPIPILVK